jgi:nucleoid-associated protein YgaU
LRSVALSCHAKPGDSQSSNRASGLDELTQALAKEERRLSMGILESLGLRKKKEAPETGKTIKVGPRDTLRSIAKREYGDESKYILLYEKNKWRIDGDEVVVGQDLFVPDIKASDK